MANQEHLDILKQGVETWNQWRKEHSKTQPDFSEADLSMFDLNHADLRGANLRRAVMRGSNHVTDSGITHLRTHLSGANLSEADLSEADLYRADLYQANLSGANLSGAHLIQAALPSADLRGANLRGANLNAAYLGQARLFDANLSRASLRQATLNSAILHGADLRGADLSGAHLRFAYLREADLNQADLSQADLSFATLNKANLSQANLSGTDLSFADLRRSDLSFADLSHANLSFAIFVETKLKGATLTDCHIYGISVWNVELTGAIQNSLVITSEGESTITVDNLKIAQFIYLLLNNAEIREVIDTITSKVVLILGRFTPERKAVLDALREELRKHNYSPVLFDFEKPASRDLTGTMSILAHLARFIIVDLTDPRSAPHEVATVIPQTVVPVQPLLLRELLIVDGKEVERRAYSMFKDMQRRYHWVLPTYFYTDQDHLLATLKEHVIAPAEQKAQELEKR